MAPMAIGPYSQAVNTNGFLFISGQLPINPHTSKMAEGVAGQTRQSLDNIGGILNGAGLTYSDVVKTTVLLADIKDFPVMNAAYADYFPDEAPARACYQVAALPMGALVEIEAIAVASVDEAPKKQRNRDGKFVFPDSLSQRAQKACEVLGITTIEDVALHTKEDFLALDNVGTGTVKELKKILFKMGMEMKESTYLTTEGEYVSISDNPISGEGKAQKDWVYELFGHYKSYDAVKEITDLSDNILQEYIVKGLKCHKLNRTDVINPDRERYLVGFIKDHPDLLDSGMKRPIREALNNEYEYWEIVIALSEINRVR